jgi:hypothetical protein
MNIGTEVTWDRGDLPDGEGVVVEIKEDAGMHMVRDTHGNLHGFPEHQVGTVMKAKTYVALP